MNNRVQFNSLDVIPAFGVPLYITNVDIAPGFIHHCNQLIFHRDTGKTLNDAVASEYRAWELLIYTQFQQFAGSIGLISETNTYSIQRSFVRKVTPGQKVSIGGTYSASFTGFCFFNETASEITWTSPYDSWQTATPKYEFAATNLLNSKTWSFKPNVGQFTIYPSSMSVEISENETDHNLYLLEFYLE